MHARKLEWIVTALFVALVCDRASALVPCTGEPVSSTALFVPADYVPLSDFKLKGVSQQVTLSVHPEILDWIHDQEPSNPLTNLRVAIQNASGGINLFAPTTVNWSAGTVKLNNAVPGRCVVVSGLLLHNPRVATHWKADLNAGRGGQWLGGKDGLNVWDYQYDQYDLDAVPPNSKHQLTSALGSNGEVGNTNPVWGNPPGTPATETEPEIPSTHPYAYASDRIALFSDGTSEHLDAAVPAYERYIGENYSTDAFTELAAIWLSDRARELTGFPIAHRSHPDAFAPCGESYSSAEPGHAVENDLPLFQVVHCHEVAPDDLPEFEGNEHSLATFILPPGWSADVPAATYPVLFNGFYDINVNTFVNEGMGFVQTLATLHTQTPARTVVGLLWNGGGGQSFHRSMYDNAAQLFDDAACLLKADKHTMVFTGGSRGGTVALAVASNPYKSTDPDKYDYSARIVNARGPQVRVGENVKTFMNPSHPDLVIVVDAYTGYQNSWTSGWVEPGSLPGAEKHGKDVVLRNFFDTEVPHEVDALCNDSDAFRAGLVAAGTAVVLRFGTHDSHGSSSLVADYVNHLLQDGVPLLCDVFYRFGHAMPYTQPDDATLLNMAILGLQPVSQIRFSRTNPEDFQDPQLIDPDYVPLAIEGPLYLGETAQMPPPTTHSWTAMGNPGAHVELRISDTSLEPFDEFGNHGFVAWSDCLPNEGPLASVAMTFASPPPLGGLDPWYYYVTYDPDGSGPLPMTILHAGTVADPTHAGSDPFFVVVPGEVIQAANFSRTGGVAEDGQFEPD